MISTDFSLVLRPDASAPVVVKIISLPSYLSMFQRTARRGFPESFNLSLLLQKGQTWHLNDENRHLRDETPRVWKRGSFGKGVFSEKSISRDSRDSREPPERGKQRRIRPFSRDS